MVRFACPVCNAVIKARGRNAVGRKVNCPKCGQRLEIPPPLRGTILAKPLPSVSPDVAPNSTIEVTEKTRTRPRNVWVGSLVALAWFPTLLSFVCFETAFRNSMGCHPWERPIGDMREVPSHVSALAWVVFGSVVLGISVTLVALFHVLKNPRSWPTLGGLLVLIGVGIVLYFWVIYDTSVFVYSYAPQFGRVHNIGRMQDRLIGTIVGLGSCAAGIAFLVMGHRRRKHVT